MLQAQLVADHVELGFLRLRLAEQAGNQRAAADTRQTGQAQRDVEYRQDQRSARDHVRVVRLPHVKRVRHVVDEDDQLTDHRGDDHFAQRGRDRQFLKQILFGKVRLGLHSLST